MEYKMKLLDEFKAYVERNFPAMHVVIIDDAIQQFKKKLIIEKADEQSNLIENESPFRPKSPGGIVPR